MKKVLKPLFTLIAAGALFVSCNNKGTSSTETSKDSSSTTATVQKMDYPYTIAHPDYWETGSQQNTMVALKALKAWEKKNMDETMSYFADSVMATFNGFDKMVSRDTLKAMISPTPGTSYKVKMQDWESVISTDKKEEYVSIWYRQYSETAKGVKDSVDVMNDLKMKDGKIIAMDEYMRKLH